MFADAELHWQNALKLLEAQGEDVPELLRRAVENVARFGNGNHVLPERFPADEV